jgi:hypothetical protein
MNSSVDFRNALGDLDKNSEMIREYWRDLRASWQASENALRRTLFYILALAASFILLGTKDVGELTFLGLTLTNRALVVTLIPAIIAYLIYVVSTNAAITYRLSAVHDGLARCYWPSFYTANLELTVRPSGSIGENELVTNEIDNSFLAGLAMGAGVTRFLIYIFAPILFEVYALWQVFAHGKEALWLECIVATFSFLAILASAPNFIYALKALKDDL